MASINLSVKEGVDFKVPESVAAKAATLTGMSNGSIKVAIASLAFLDGRAARDLGANVVPSFKVPFDAWRVAHYVGDRKMPKDTSLATMLSGFNGLTALGFLKYDATSALNAIFGFGNISYSDMGAWAERIAAAYPETLPNGEQIAALAPKKKAATAKSDAIKGADDVEDKYGVKGKWFKFLVTPEQKLAAMDLVSAYQTLRDVLPEDVQDDDETNYRAEARKLRAEIKAAADKRKAEIEAKKAATSA